MFTDSELDAMIAKMNIEATKPVEMITMPHLIKTGIVTVKWGKVITSANGQEFVESKAAAELWSNGLIFAKVTDRITGKPEWRNIKPNSVDFS